jgi:hypothetical protein
MIEALRTLVKHLVTEATEAQNNTITEAEQLMLTFAEKYRDDLLEHLPDWVKEDLTEEQYELNDMFESEATIEDLTDKKYGIHKLKELLYNIERLQFEFVITGSTSGYGYRYLRAKVSNNDKNFIDPSQNFILYSMHSNVFLFYTCPFEISYNDTGLFSTRLTFDNFKRILNVARTFKQFITLALRLNMK